VIRIILYTAVALAAIYGVVIAGAPWEIKRKVRHYSAYAIGLISAILALIPLVLLIGYLAEKGLPGLNTTFFTATQRPLGEPGSGMKHAILGSLLIVGLASAIGVPIGIGAGIYLAEFGRGKFASAIRFLSEVLTGLPSIIAGILGYTLIVVRFGGFSAWAGAFALAILMIPVITRVTEEAILLVPKGLVEASLGLGAGKFVTIWRIVLPAARSAIMTGVILAVARVGGETAPLLFTSAGQSIVNFNPNKATAALPLSIFLNANQPFESSQSLAITGALFLVIWIAVINLVMRWIAVKTQPRLG
jgi:phosphate transport system permease protein